MRPRGEQGCSPWVHTATSTGYGSETGVELADPYWTTSDLRLDDLPAHGADGVLA